MNRKIICALVLGLLVGFSHAESDPAEYSKKVNSSDIIEDLIKNKPVSYNNVEIVNGITLPSNIRRINVPINITNSKINGSILAREVTFSGSIDLNGTVFLKRAIFENSVFQSGVNFSGSSFSDWGYFRKAQFNGAADFSNARIKKADFLGSQFMGDKLDFSSCNFIENSDFSDAIFTSPVDFSSANFSSEAQFTGARFGEKPDFENVFFDKVIFNDVTFVDGAIFTNTTCINGMNFNGINTTGLSFSMDKSRLNNSDFSESDLFTLCIFRDTEFNGTTIFDDGEFAREARFINSTFRGDVSFNGSKFSDNLDFSQSKFLGYLYLDHAQVDKDITFNGAVFFKNLTTPERFLWIEHYPFRVSLSGTKFGRLFLKWESIKEGLLAYDEDTYLGLIDNYKKIGWIRDANDCQYEYKLNYRNSLSPFYKLIDMFYWVSCGYGVKPEWTAVLSTLLVIIFSAYYIVNDGRSIASAFTFSSTVFLSGTGRLFIEKPSYEPRRNNQLSFSVFTLERILGGVLLFLLLISLSRTVSI